MGGTLWAILIAVGVLIVLICGIAVARARTLTGRVGSFYCALRPVGAPVTAWHSGIAHYCVDRIDWYRLISLSPRPARSWPRDDLQLLENAPMQRGDGIVGGPNVRLRCRSNDEEFDVAVSSGAFSGITSWLEAAPPGRHGRVV